MDREGFKNRLKQYKKAREENPGLKYWDWKNIPKYDEGGKVDQNEYSPVWPRISKTERQIYFDRINPAAGFGFGDFVAQGMNYYFPEGERQKAPKEDEARWAAYLGLSYDKKYAPDTKIRFAHDKDYPNRQYQGLSKDAKKEIREEIIPTLQKSYSKLGDKWILITDEKPTDIIRNDEMYYPRLNHIGDLGKFGIREVNGSGIYEVGDKYDFPWYVPIPNRADGHELMIRDTIWSDRAKPELYIQRKAEGGEVQPDPLEVLERSRPKVAGIPINDKPLSGTDPLGELYLNLVSGNAVRKAVVNGVNGIVRKSFYDNYKELLKAGWNRQRAYNYASPELGIAVLPGITKGFDYAIRGANYTHAVEDFVK